MSLSNRLPVPLFKRFRWVFVLLILLLGLAVVALAVLQPLLTPREDPQQVEIARAVRAGFPQFCMGSQLVIEPALSGTEPDSYWIGCSST